MTEEQRDGELYMGNTRPDVERRENQGPSGDAGEGNGAMTDTDRRALAALDIDEEPCGPPGRECGETFEQRCPHHGGGPWEKDEVEYVIGGPWNDADEAEWQKWRKRTS